MQSRFRSLIGSLMFAAISWRVDILMKVVHLARFVSMPNEKICKAGMRIPRYLKKTSNYGIKFSKVPCYTGKIQPMLMTCTDSNYAADKDGVSTSCYMVQLTDRFVWDKMTTAQPVNLNLVSYASKRQREVTQSSTETEYIAGALSVKNLLHEKYLMEELGFSQPSMPMFFDNTAVRFMANEWKVTEKSKHINTRYHLLRYHAIKGTVVIYYIDTLENVADIGTKPLPVSMHGYLIKKIMDGTVSSEVRPTMVIRKRQRRVLYDDRGI